MSEVKSPPRTRRRGPEYRDVEAAMLAAAREVFGELGYQGASVDLIAARAKVSKATVYAYFTGKEALFTRMIREFCDEQEAAFRGIEAQQLPLAEELQRIARSILDALNHPGALRMNRMVMGEAARFPLIGRMFVEAGVHQLVQAVGRIFRDLNEAGRLDIPDPLLAAELFIGMLRSPLQLRSLRDMGRPLPEADLDKIVAGAVDMLLRACRRGPLAR